MPDLFSPYTLKGVTLRNRIAMSPMTMYNSVDGRLDDYHVSYLGARAAGGFGLVFGEQMAIAPDGRTTTSCAGIWDDDQIEGHARVCAIVERMGGVPAIQLGHTGRKGSELPPHKGTNEQGTWKQLPPDHEHGWECVGPSAIPYGGGGHIYPVRELSVDDIKALHQSYADAARRALAAGYKWLEMHYAHGYLGASFFSPLANQRTDQYGGSVENRVRFHLEALDAVRAVWPEEYPLTMRLGSDDLHPEGVQFEDSIVAIRMMKEHGLDLADLSLGFNTDEMTNPPMNEVGFMLKRANRVREEVGIPGGDELEPRRARQRGPCHPRGADRPRVPGPSGAGQPPLARLGGARAVSTTTPSTSCRRTGPGGSATSAATGPPSACPPPRARRKAGPPRTACGGPGRT